MRDYTQQNKQLSEQKDRITNLLRTQSQPASLPQEIGNISQSLLSALSQGTGAAGYQQAYRGIQDQNLQNQTAQLQREKGLYDMMQDEIKQGNEEAGAVDKAIRDITGNDIGAYEKIASELHNSPDPVNRQNATLLASKAAAKMQYRPLSLQADEADIAYKKAQIAKSYRPDAANSGGATGVLIQRYMEATGANFPQALHAVQSGMRQGLTLDAEGNIAPMPKFTEARTAIKAAESKGTEIGKKEGELTSKSISAPQVLNLVSQAEELLPQATSGRLQNIYTAGTQAIGKSTKMSKADSRLDVIAAGLTSNVPRMEGPQSDADTRLYKEAAGNVGNRNLPAGDRMAALQTVKGLNEKYLNNQTSSAPAQLSVGTKKGGYTYIGGDPANPKSWSK